MRATKWNQFRLIIGKDIKLVIIRKQKKKLIAGNSARALLLMRGEILAHNGTKFFLKYVQGISNEIDPLFIPLNQKVTTDFHRVKHFIC
jgi:hypothetical protein